MAEARADAAAQLGDFTASRRVLSMSALAVVIGVISACVARALLLLIACFTNIFFFQRASAVPSSPADSTLGPWTLVVPVVGALIVGLMARYGSERIRGHGIPGCCPISASASGRS